METKNAKSLPEFEQAVISARSYEALLVTTGFIAGLIVGLSMCGIL